MGYAVELTKAAQEYEASSYSDFHADVLRILSGEVTACAMFEDRLAGVSPDQVQGLRDHVEACLDAADQKRGSWFGERIGWDGEEPAPEDWATPSERKWQR